MAWIITGDHLWKPGDSGRSAEGTRSPGWSEEKDAARPLSYAFYRFRMYDDDGILYYEGRCTNDGDFMPLDDFGEPAAGCTEIRYWRSGVWETL